MPSSQRARWWHHNTARDDDDDERDRDHGYGRASRQGATTLDARDADANARARTAAFDKGLT